MDIGFCITWASILEEDTQRLQIAPQHRGSKKANLEIFITLQMQYR